MGGRAEGNGQNDGNHLTPLKGGKDIVGGGGSSLIRVNHNQLLLGNVQGANYG